MIDVGLLTRRFLFRAAMFSVFYPVSIHALSNGLNISDFRETFSDDFRGGLDVSSRGPGTRWIAHTPWNGDFGDARFVDPTEGFPFTTGSDGLRIEARKGVDGKWRSGLLACRGFSQTGGYFEARLKMPPGPGVWPAFWLVSELVDPNKGELDIVEYYGRRPDRYETTLHVWPKNGAVGPHQSRIVDVEAGSLSSRYHLFGALIDREFTIIYLDRNEVARFDTPPSFKGPMYMLVDLALGSGWPIDETPNPSYLYVDYIKAFARK